MKTVILSFLFLLSITGINCTKDNLGIKVCSNCPQCLIDNLILEPVRNPPAELYKWTINNEIYYYVTSFCCDAESQLYDAKCYRVCSPDGGFSGGGDGMCPSFFPPYDSIPKELIWKDRR